MDVSKQITENCISNREKIPLPIILPVRLADYAVHINEYILDEHIANRPLTLHLWSFKSTPLHGITEFYDGMMS